MAKQVNYCCFCGEICSAVKQGYLETSVRYNCKVCGNYVTPDLFDVNHYCNKDMIASYLFYNCNFSLNHRNRDKFFVLTTNDNKDNYTNHNYIKVTPEIIEAFYPKTFSERIDKILLCIAKASSYIGDSVKLTYGEMHSACFVTRYDELGNTLLDQQIASQISAIVKYLKDNEYLSCSGGPEGFIIQLLPDGWKRVDELQRDISKGKDVFIAMSYDKEMNDVEDAIKSAVATCEYNPIILKDLEYNHQIVPEMLHQIRQAKFVIAELTNHNNGAYYEAGYALALGKQVIHLCKKSSFGEDGHFDVKQINTILWNDTEDLKDKLIKRINATIGKED